MARKKPSVADTWMQIAKERGMTAQPAAARRAGQQLWKLLEDPLGPVRLAAGFAVASVRDASIVQAFILVLEGASSARMAKAALTLGEAGFVNAAPYIRAGFSRDDAKLSAAVARALGQLADRESTAMLIEALDDGFVPAEAAEALGKLGDPAAGPALTRALAHSSDAVRAAAAYALGCLPAMPGSEERRVRYELEAKGDDPSRRVRLCAAVARYERGDEKGLAAIHAALS